MNWTDYFLIALVVLSCIAGLVRGLLREVIALVTWIAAVWLAWAYAPLLEPHLGGALAGEGVRPWAARALIFIVVVLVGTAIGVAVSHFVRLSLFIGLDRFFGAIFGLLRGWVIVGLFVILCHALKLDGQSWWRSSMLMPYGEHAANVLRGMVGERKIHGHFIDASD
ncbi:MAG TPA: CvpA family protein [Steroidobacteraceae bacterium]|jgi:membrane protein required for colicin V production|nr:CvpA family protein [Steroidobacteraceae bacterium]